MIIWLMMVCFILEIMENMMFFIYFYFKENINKKLDGLNKIGNEKKLKIKRKILCKILWNTSLLF